MFQLFYTCIKLHGSRDNIQSRVLHKNQKSRIKNQPKFFHLNLSNNNHPQQINNPSSNVQVQWNVFQRSIVTSMVSWLTMRSGWTEFKKREEFHSFHVSTREATVLMSAAEIRTTRIHGQIWTMEMETLMEIITTIEKRSTTSKTNRNSNNSFKWAMET